MRGLVPRALHLTLRISLRSRSAASTQCGALVQVKCPWVVVLHMATSPSVDHHAHVRRTLFWRQTLISAYPALPRLVEAGILALEAEVALEVRAEVLPQQHLWEWEVRPEADIPEHPDYKWLNPLPLTI